MLINANRLLTKILGYPVSFGIWKQGNIHRWSTSQQLYISFRDSMTCFQCFKNLNLEEFVKKTAHKSQISKLSEKFTQSFSKYGAQLPIQIASQSDASRRSSLGKCIYSCFFLVQETIIVFCIYVLS